MNPLERSRPGPQPICGLFFQWMLCLAPKHPTCTSKLQLRFQQREPLATPCPVHPTSAPSSALLMNRESPKSPVRCTSLCRSCSRAAPGKRWMSWEHPCTGTVHLQNNPEETPLRFGKDGGGRRQVEGPDPHTMGCPEHTVTPTPRAHRDGVTCGHCTRDLS